ncbi:hypothetical protein G7046_g6924 [Stylonectria norvegica]|nr:hypothetical protein G7046_g6924 [Stylonectria norvegica]
MLLANSSFSVLLAVLLHFVGAHPQSLVCTSQSQSNPIKTIYPNDVTGLLNATLAIVAIPLKTAQQILPYKILESAYRSLLPDFPKGMYPVLVQAAYDHDINFQNFQVPDFTRAGYEFPFLDLLGDGYSSFRWAPHQLITSTNVVAIEGSEAYGTDVAPAKFNPQCDAYGGGKHETYFKAKSVDSKKFITLDFAPLKHHAPTQQLLNYYHNVTNQPSFANGTTCDQQIRFFNTSVSEAPFAPVSVRGDVRSKVGPFKGERSFKGIDGIQIATAFIERNYLDCKSLKGLPEGPRDDPTQPVDPLKEALIEDCFTYQGYLHQRPGFWYVGSASFADEFTVVGRMHTCAIGFKLKNKTDLASGPWIVGNRDLYNILHTVISLDYFWYHPELQRSKGAAEGELNCLTKPPEWQLDVRVTNSDFLVRVWDAE